MIDWSLTAWLRWLGGTPCFRIHAKTRRETAWRIVDVFATARRNRDSRWLWPFWQGTCITWTSQIVVVGWDFAAEVLHEQQAEPASREQPVEVAGGRLRDALRRAAVRAGERPQSSEVLAHEVGHTAQVRRLGWLYWPVGGLLTLFREGPHFWNHFENDASEQGQFGGLVNGSVCAALLARPRSSARQRS
jgi:hypothetical protein